LQTCEANLIDNQGNKFNPQPLYRLGLSKNYSRHLYEGVNKNYLQRGNLFEKPMDYFKIKEKRTLTRVRLINSLKDETGNTGDYDHESILDFIYGLANLAIKVQLRLSSIHKENIYKKRPYKKRKQ